MFFQPQRAESGKLNGPLCDPNTTSQRETTNPPLAALELREAVLLRPVLATSKEILICLI